MQTLNSEDKKDKMNPVIMVTQLTSLREFLGHDEEKGTQMNPSKLLKLRKQS